jgi:uncharacterized protein (DUF952 family)
LYAGADDAKFLALASLREHLTADNCNLIRVPGKGLSIAAASILAGLDVLQQCDVAETAGAFENVGLPALARLLTSAEAADFVSALAALNTKGKAKNISALASSRLPIVVNLSYGVFTGAPVDLADGYIHMSTADQLDETLAKHFAGQIDLTIAEIDLTALGDSVRWEISRGNQLFPHIYGVLPMHAVRGTMFR